MRACVYVRVSTDEQALKGYSLEEQIRKCKEKARELGAVGDIFEFIDDGYSGDDPERPGMLALISAVEKREFELVVCYDLDRWARDLGDQILFARRVERYARLEFVTHSRGSKDSPEDTMFFHMKGAFAQYEKAKIRQRTITGKKAKAQKGKISCVGGWEGHPGPFGYGYNPDTSQFIINEKEAEIVRMIFDLHDKEGMGISKIVITLNEMKIPSPKGSKWHTSTVARILHNEAYAGIFYNFKRKTESISGKLKKCEIRPKEQWIPIEVPPIISREQWERVQKTISKNAVLSREKKYNYLFQGHIFCGECGRRVYTTPKTNSTGVHLYYRCAGKKKEVTLNTCKTPMYPASSKNEIMGIDDLVWNFLVEALKNPELIVREINKVKDNSEEELREDLSKKLTKKQKHLEDLERQIDEAWDMRLEGYLLADDLKKRLQKIEKRKNDLTLEINNINNKLKYLEDKRNFSKNIEEYCKLVSHKLDNLTFEEKREIIRLLDIKVYIFADKRVEIEWPFSKNITKVGDHSHDLPGRKPTSCINFNFYFMHR